MTSGWLFSTASVDSEQLRRAASLLRRISEEQGGRADRRRARTTEVRTAAEQVAGVSASPALADRRDRLSHALVGAEQLDAVTGQVVRAVGQLADLAVRLGAELTDVEAAELMTAIMYYAGLRPSEVVMLRPRALVLPKNGWGAINVVEADIDFDEPGEPKTGNRTVPIPAELVARLRRWVDEQKLADTALMFRTRTGRMPTPSNWGRCLHRACRNAGQPPMRVYDCRHTCATTWLRVGVPLGEVARRLGHSAETLVSVYVGALDGDDTEANKRIDSATS